MNNRTDKQPKQHYSQQQSHASLPLKAALQDERESLPSRFLNHDISSPQDAHGQRDLDQGSICFGSDPRRSTLPSGSSTWNSRAQEWFIRGLRMATPRALSSLWSFSASSTPTQTHAPPRPWSLRQRYMTAPSREMQVKSSLPQLAFLKPSSPT